MADPGSLLWWYPCTECQIPLPGAPGYKSQSGQSPQSAFSLLTGDSVPVSAVQEGWLSHQNYSVLGKTHGAQCMSHRRPEKDAWAHRHQQALGARLLHTGGQKACCSPQPPWLIPPLLGRAVPQEIQFPLAISRKDHAKCPPGLRAPGV